MQIFDVLSPIWRNQLNDAYLDGAQNIDGAQNMTGHLVSVITHHQQCSLEERIHLCVVYSTSIRHFATWSISEAGWRCMICKYLWSRTCVDNRSLFPKWNQLVPRHLRLNGTPCLMPQTSSIIIITKLVYIILKFQWNLFSVHLNLKVISGGF